MAKSTGKRGIDILEEMYRSVDEGSVSNGMEMLADDIVWHEPEGLSIGGTYHGPDAVREVLGSLMAAFENASFDPERYVEDGERVIVFGTFTGIHAETGKSVEIPLVHVWTFDAGRAIEFRRYTDTATLNWALEA
jgi:ketosteroid isomerase-like protein